MTRRAFIMALGGALAAWPLAARAQQGHRRLTVGVLGESTASDASTRSTAFQQRLRELGWIEGSTIAIEYRWAEGRRERFAEIADELVRLKVDIIVTVGGAVPILKQATSVIPIVFTIDADPVGRGLVASLSRPGGNVTGLSGQQTDLVGKRLELLHELVPGLRRLAVLANSAFPGALQEIDEIKAAAARLSLEVSVPGIRRAADIALAFDMINDQADALYVCGDAFAFTNRIRINTLAHGAHLPTVFGAREYVEGDGLMSYGPSFTDLYRRAADLVDRILRGAKPADIPVEQPTKFELVVSLTTAKAIKLKISESFLLRADEVIE
jgi:putative tryptophan/tyrosine transport system substrate-binding protein